MKRIATALSLVAAMGSVPALAETEVKTIGLVVGSADIEAMDFNFRPPGLEPGTRVHVLVSGFDAPVVALNDDDSQVSSATDSTGVDLLARPEQSGQMGFSMTPSTIGPFPRISADGSQLAVELRMPRPPSAGAESLDVDATLVVVQATGSKQVKSDPVALQPGKVAIGDEQIEVREVGPNDWEPDKHTVALRMTADQHQRTKTVKILDEQGEVLSDGANSTMTMNQTVDQQFTVDALPDKAVIVLELYEGMETVEVPVKVSVGLGLGE